jgi:hypothetical protein
MQSNSDSEPHCMRSTFLRRSELEIKMSHDKKKAKKTVEDGHLPGEPTSDAVKGSGKNAQKGSGDVKSDAKNTAPDTKIDSKKGSKSKK